MAADNLVPCVARSSTPTVLNVKYMRVLVLYEVRFQLPQPFQSLEMLENSEITLYFFK